VLQLPNVHAISQQSQCLARKSPETKKKSLSSQLPAQLPVSLAPQTSPTQNSKQSTGAATDKYKTKKRGSQIQFFTQKLLGQ